MALRSVAMLQRSIHKKETMIESCDLFLQHEGLPMALRRDPTARYHVINGQGEHFKLCAWCLEYYKRKHPNWRSLIQIERLDGAPLTTVN